MCGTERGINYTSIACLTERFEVMKALDLRRAGHMSRPVRLDVRVNLHKSVSLTTRSEHAIAQQQFQIRTDIIMIHVVLAHKLYVCYIYSKYYNLQNDL